MYIACGADPGNVLAWSLICGNRRQNIHRIIHLLYPRQSQLQKGSLPLPVLFRVRRCAVASKCSYKMNVWMAPACCTGAVIKLLPRSSGGDFVYPCDSIALTDVIQLVWTKVLLIFFTVAGLGLCLGPVLGSSENSRDVSEPCC